MYCMECNIEHKLCTVVVEAVLLFITRRQWFVRPLAVAVIVVCIGIVVMMVVVMMRVMVRMVYGIPTTATTKIMAHHQCSRLR